MSDFASKAVLDIATALDAEYKRVMSVYAGATGGVVARVNAINARSAELRAENARRAASGVRVKLNADSFDARHVKMLEDTVDHFKAHTKALEAAVNSLASLAARSVKTAQTIGEVLRKAEAVALEQAAARAAEQAAAADAAHEARQHAPRHGNRWV